MCPPFKKETFQNSAFFTFPLMKKKNTYIVSLVLAVLKSSQLGNNSLPLDTVQVSSVTIQLTVKAKTKIISRSRGGACVFSALSASPTGLMSTYNHVTINNPCTTDLTLNIR